MNDVQNIWKTNDVQDVLIELVEDDNVQKSEIIKFLISRIENIYTVDALCVICHNNCMEVVKALAELGKFNEKLKFEYLIKAIQNANLDVVKFILEDEPSLVKEKLTEDCFAEDDDYNGDNYDDNGRYSYFVKKGSDILKLALKVKKHSDNYLLKLKKDGLCQKSANQYCKKMEKIFEFIAKVKTDEKKMQNASSSSNNSNSTNYPSSDIEDEMESDTDSIDDDFELLDLDEPISEDFEVIGTDENPLPILDYCGSSTESIENDSNDAMEEDDKNPRSTVHSPSATCSSQTFSRRH